MKLKEAIMNGYIFEMEFLRMIGKNPDFKKVVSEDGTYDIGVDVIAEYKGEKVIIEFKSAPSISSNRLSDIANQLNNLRAKRFAGHKAILAFPGELVGAQTLRIMGHGIEIWDIHTLSEIFKDQIKYIESKQLKEIFSSAQKNTNTIEDDFIDKIQRCPKGKTHWNVYQKLCGEIFEHLFTPSLGQPILERPDYSKANRRDIIMPNYAEAGFWSFLRDKYCADYIVIDAKNYTKKVDKPVVLQMANYLKDYGVGLFGIVVHRSSLMESAIHTRRETWLIDRKLIIFLDESDVESMLTAKKNSNSPEDIIKQKIEDFRIDL